MPRPTRGTRKSTLPRADTESDRCYDTLPRADCGRKWAGSRDYVRGGSGNETRSSRESSTSLILMQLWTEDKPDRPPK